MVKFLPLNPRNVARLISPGGKHLGFLRQRDGEWRVEDWAGAEDVNPVIFGPHSSFAVAATLLKLAC